MPVKGVLAPSLKTDREVRVAQLSPDTIVFIDPPYECIAPGYEFVRHIADNSPSLGLLHLAAQAREDGYHASIIECTIQGLDVEQTIDRVVAQRPAFVGISLFTVGVWSAARIARGVKRSLPDTKILVGGPHISSMGLETMSRFPDFDLAVVGEGEETLSEVLACYRSGGDIGAVNGVIYRDAQDRPQRTAPRRIEKDLDRLPYPAWDLLPGFPDAYLPGAYEFPHGPVASIAASRGCPFKCRFCDTSTFGARLRHYSPAKVVELIKYVKNRYGVRHIVFVDDLFLANRKRATEFCELLIEASLGVTWNCLARADSVRPELLALMKRAGCWEIMYGLESGSDQILQKMEKSLSVEKSRQAVEWTAEAGIRVRGLFMLGYPGETEETIAETRAFISSIPLDVMQLTKFTPYPGSPVYVDIYGKMICEEHWDKMNGMTSVWTPEGMTVEQLDRHYNRILWSFYRRPAALKLFARMTWHYPDHLYRGVRFGLGFLWSQLRRRSSGVTGPGRPALDPPTPAGQPRPDQAAASHPGAE